jgi:AraC-like DNA-binding protein
MPEKKFSKNVPLLEGDSYREAYFKHPLAGRPSPEVAPVGHFHLHNRCIWKNAIPAHRLDFYMVFLVTEGEGIHAFGLQEHYIRKNMLCFIGPNVINAWHSEQEVHQGFFCAFSDDFFNLGRENKQFLSGLPFFGIDGHAVLHLSEEKMNCYTALFKLMETEYRNPTPFTDEILRGYLHALIHKAYAAHRLLQCPVSNADHPGLRLFKAFTALYLRDFDAVKEGKVVRPKTVAGYADELGISGNHLNDTIKAVTGQSAGRLIRNQLIKQATMCLKHSTKTISEIAYQLGFADPSYFSRFYKSQTGKSPSDYR